MTHSTITSDLRPDLTQISEEVVESCGRAVGDRKVRIPCKETLLAGEQ